MRLRRVFLDLPSIGLAPQSLVLSKIPAIKDTGRQPPAHACFGEEMAHTTTQFQFHDRGLMTQYKRLWPTFCAASSLIDYQGICS